MEAARVPGAAVVVNKRCHLLPPRAATAGEGRGPAQSWLTHAGSGSAAHVGGLCHISDLK